MSLAYLGGKWRQSKTWAPLILSLTDKRFHYLEPFLGGANMITKLAPHFTLCQAGDVHPDLMAMWQAVKLGTVDFPTHVSAEDYALLKQDYKDLGTGRSGSAIRGFAGFGCSFGAMFFATYHDGAAKTRRAIMKSQAALQDTELRTCSYLDWDQDVSDRSVIYADPPYEGTAKYSVDALDYVAFWNKMREWRTRGAAVFVSSYKAPDDWTCVSQLDLAKTISSTKNGARQLDCLYR